MTEMSAFLDVPLNDSAPAAARRVVEAILRAWGFTNDGWLKTAKVVVSELVTTAVRRGAGVGGIHLQTVRGQVIVTAIDRYGQAQGRELNDIGGHGVAIVGAFSSRWGVGDYPSGTRVWVELVPHPHETEDFRGGTR